MSRSASWSARRSRSGSGWPICSGHYSRYRRAGRLRSAILSVSGEPRRALFEKGGRALAIIVAVERLADQHFDLGPLRFDIAGGESLQNAFRAGDRQRRVRADRHPERDRILDDIAVHDRIGEPHIARRGGVEQLAAVQDALGIGEADDRKQKPAFRDSVDRAEFGRRNAEPGAAMHDSEIAAQGNRATAADAGPGDRRDARLRQAADRLIAGADFTVIGGAAGAGGPRPRELADIRAGAEMSAGSGQHRQPDVAVGGDSAEGGGEVAPSLQV